MSQTLIDTPTLAEIDQALAHLRDSLHTFDGDPKAQAIVHHYMDALLDQRLTCHHSGPA